MLSFFAPRFLPSLSGFDNHIISSLRMSVVIQLYLLSIACIAVAAMTGFGFYYISQISESNVYLSVVLAIVGFIFCLNLFRMMNAGGSYPIGFNQQDIQSWQPSYISFLVIVFVGSLLTIPCAIYFHNVILMPSNDDIVGLVGNWNAMVAHPQQAIFTIVLFAVLFSSFYWLRYIFINAIRQYEMLGWSISRQLVNDNQQQFFSITNGQFYSDKNNVLDPEKHFSDPPYNFKMKLFSMPIAEVMTFSRFIPEVENEVQEESINNEIEHQENKGQLLAIEQHPSYFNEVARSVLCSSSSTVKAELVEYLGVDEFAVEQRIVRSEMGEKLESVFAFELENQDILNKYSNALAKTNQSPKSHFVSTASHQFTQSLTCPICVEELSMINTASGGLYHCSTCSASLYSVNQMTNYFGQDFDADFLRNRVYTLYQGPQHKKCPIDDDWLEKFTVLSPTSSEGYGKNELLSKDVDLLVSNDYQYYWLSDKYSQSLADSLKEHQQRKKTAENTPLQMGHYLLQLLTAIPFEVYNPVRKIPVALVSIILLMVAIFFFQLKNLPISSSSFLLYPNLFLDKPLTLISSMLMHANLQHLLGNILFLWIFADNIEDKYGWKVFVIIFFLAGVCGSLLHVAFNLESNIGLLGASGGVYGIMGAYFVFYKQVKVWWVIAFIRFKVSIILFAFFRVAMDVYGIFFSESNIAWFAHIGGFFAGVFMALIIKNRLLDKIIFYYFRHEVNSEKTKT